MALYAVIEGEDAETVQYAGELEDHLADDEVLYIDAATDLDDAAYDEMANCESGIVLGEIDDERVERLRELDDVPIVSDREYEGFLSFDYGEEVVEVLGDRLREAKDQYRSSRLKEEIADADSLAILLHDTPDPDAIAAGVTVQQIAEQYSIDADIYHGGRVNHQENRALVNRLDFDLNAGEPEWEDYDSIALLDTAPGNAESLQFDDEGLVNGEGEEIDLDIVIDHHQGWDDR
ncbi:MAG: hypothetical protein SVU32_00300, partial [Candidatus Nanohaloarchaea archaeon]|nr:hypothetical protein [Candidatus Nanohaloarchaea archaeon]